MAKKLVTRSVLITGKRRYNHAKLLRVSGSNFSIFFRKLIDSKAEMVRFWFRHTEVRMRPLLRTSFHHQPEAQHPKSSAIHNNASRLPHLISTSDVGWCGRYVLFRAKSDTWSTTDADKPDELPAAGAQFLCHPNWLFLYCAHPAVGALCI